MIVYKQLGYQYMFYKRIYDLIKQAQKMTKLKDTQNFNKLQIQ